uniref:Uncharacterized protein n=1 Tax=Anopheles dirus TaxID=7168 RepID=A0A182NWK6_9DIPT
MREWVCVSASEVFGGSLVKAIFTFKRKKSGLEKQTDCGAVCMCMGVGGVVVLQLRRVM